LIDTLPFPPGANLFFRGRSAKQHQRLIGKSGYMKFGQVDRILAVPDDTLHDEAK
jgi:hypothetical protein